MAISMLKIRRPLGRLIFNMGIAIPGKTVFLIETAPWLPRTTEPTLTDIGNIYRGPLLLTWFNFDQSIDKESHAL